MATLNAEVVTALRLGLTYTHRVARYGSLVSLDFKQNIGSGPEKGSVAGLSPVGGRVEGFFGWGVGEIPREAVQEAACKVRDGTGALHECKICTQRDLEIVKKEMKGRTGSQPRLRVDCIVEVPMEFSYKFPDKRSRVFNESLARFLRRYNRPYTVFHMPHRVCGSSPTYTRFGAESRSFFFHKYWDAHAQYPGKKVMANEIRENEWLGKMYRDSWRRHLRIPGVPPRGVLDKLKEEEVTIAVHARRGDFFKDKRPMVAMKTFAKVVRRVVTAVRQNNGTFARMKVGINVYSEGMPRGGWSVGHDVKRHMSLFHDADGTVLTPCAVRRMLQDGNDGLGNVFENGMRVELRVSEDTVRSLHEMVASDVFIGSLSGMSHQIVGSLSRAGIQLFPTRVVKRGEWFSHIQYDGVTGEISEVEMNTLRAYWKIYEDANSASAAHAHQRQRPH